MCKNVNSFLIKLTKKHGPQNAKLIQKFKQNLMSRQVSTKVMFFDSLRHNQHPCFRCCTDDQEVISSMQSEINMASDNVVHRC